MVPWCAEPCLLQQMVVRLRLKVSETSLQQEGCRLYQYILSSRTMPGYARGKENLACSTPSTATEDDSK